VTVAGTSGFSVAIGMAPCPGWTTTVVVMAAGGLTAVGSSLSASNFLLIN
jgi:hypothetical protein